MPLHRLINTHKGKIIFIGELDIAVIV